MADIRAARIVQKPASKRRVSVRLFTGLKRSVSKQMIQDGYNLRQKSEWVAEAISALLSSSGWEGALLAETIAVTDDQDVYSMPSDIVDLINREIHRIALDNPSLNPSQASIVRAAIKRRLLLG